MTVHVVHVAQPTSEGVARCVVGLVRHQVGAGLQVSVVCPDDGWLAAEVTAAGGRHLSWAAQRSPGPVVARETSVLRRLLRDLDPSLVHLHSAKAGLAGRLALRGRVPTIYQPHAWSFLAVQGVLRRATLAWEVFAVRWAQRIVCVSEAECRDAVALGVPLEGRARVVPNGVDTDRYAPRERVGARARLGVADAPLAVCVGRLSEQKGQDVLLAAWPAVRRSVPDARLALVGEGPWRERLSAAAGEGVLVAGNSSDPRDWYAAADVIVVPSRWEGMALVPLEAGASGRSVVISDVAGAREAVVPGTGAVVPVEDPAALAEAVAARLRDRVGADREGVAGRDHVTGAFGLDVSGARMLDVYADLLGDPWADATGGAARG
ncbi:Glycosyltransferase involved in cell wall bisynthesis [Geodermatophilus dictyosporus]|uniref:Glycosyltransferase involved in cell wall bisynthesis n=1 Tax=Geodermatophilus dictyosporus TaxID=1523247 RepID=A0A1I5JWA3_9ACTN|nr:glycosyltransferase [Geodermatophilus dictyosporus]SFO77072.1 Glycosyltransferase involved in cell wall bisynthesis [Geodermatophilus dictyosporus]